jgi:hypothetical protein
MFQCKEYRVICNCKGTDLCIVLDSSVLQQEVTLVFKKSNLENLKPRFCLLQICRKVNIHSTTQYVITIVDSRKLGISE